MKEQEFNKPQYLTRPQISKALRDNTERILQNIEDEMKNKNILKAELAKRIDSEPTHVYRMFKNKYNKNGLTTNVLGRIAIALDVPLTQLVK